MNRYIDIDALAYKVAINGNADFTNKVTKLMIKTPTIEIVRCGECRYSEKMLSPITGLWCKRFGINDMAVEADDFCSYGKERNSDGRK